jgi:hypothetical protein
MNDSAQKTGVDPFSATCVFGTSAACKSTGIAVVVDTFSNQQNRNRSNRRNRFHHLNPPRLGRAVATGSDKSQSVYDATSLPLNPPTQLSTIDITAFVGNVTQHLAKFVSVLTATISVPDSISHHGRGLAEYRMPGCQHPRQGFPLRVFGYSRKHRRGGVGTA